MNFINRKEGIVEEGIYFVDSKVISFISEENKCMIVVILYLFVGS